MSREHGVEVLVVGGGPAGCATALSLLDQGLDPSRLELVEASRFEEERIGESIPPDTHRLFDALGVLSAFRAEDHEPCLGSASSWGDDELGYNDFIYNPYGKGWHLDRRRFDAWLAGEVEERGVTVRRGVKFLEVMEHGGKGAVLALGGPGGAPERVRARFVVDATGPRSRYARRMGAVQRQLDQLVCVTAVLRLPEDSSFTKLTMLEAVEYGWWYAARLPDQRIAVAVATSHELYLEHRFNRPSTWLDALSRTRHVAALLAECEPVADSFAVCTAASFLLDAVYGDHWLAVGDAASAYDPISSQGIIKALTDGLLAGRTIAAHLGGTDSPPPLVEHHRDVEARFAEYARQRSYFYHRERRWPHAPFWRGRRERGGVVAADAG